MYVITGATGNTGKHIAHNLLDAGKKVTVVGREASKLEEFAKKGATIAVGDLEDTAFLTKTFTGATAVYALIPPKWDVTHWRNYQRSVATAITNALKANHVPNVVVLSSNGAHLPEGAGPVSGLYEFEQQLKGVEGLNILSLRAGYFMENLFGVIGMIKGMGIFGYTLGADVKTPLVHTQDIANVATKHLLALDFKGFSHVFVPGAEDLNMNQVAETIAQVIGKADLRYIQFSDADALQGMLQAGIPQTIAEGYNELFDALNKGTYLNDYTRTPENTTPTTLKWFLENQFIHAYNA